MKELKGACIFGQSGGPTSVINASAYGCIEAALQNENITKVYAAHYGISGVLDDRLMIMDEEDPANLRLMLQTPAAVPEPVQNSSVVSASPETAEKGMPGMITAETQAQYGAEKQKITHAEWLR